MVVAKTTVWQKFLVFFMAIAAFCASTVSLVSAYWVWGPDPTYFQTAHIEKHRAWFDDGDIFVFRASKVQKAITLHISRNLLLNSGPLKEGLSMPDLVLYVDAGEYEVTRRINVPYALKSGKYELHSAVSWRANPLRTVQTPLPVVTFEVP